MSTKITINPAAPLSLTTLRDLTKQQAIWEIQGGSTGDANLAAVRYAYLRCVELWPARMKIAAAMVANDNSFVAATIDAFRDSNAP
jgi:hypothetical protein